MNKKTINEIRVPRSERLELYRDDNIIVIVPLTHNALKKYGSGCQWCINGDLSEWENYHKGLHAIIIQRKPKKLRIGITGYPIASEILIISRWGGGGYNLDDVNSILNYDFEDYQQLIDYEEEIIHDIDNFATNVVYYSPLNGIYDMEDNNMGTYKFTIRDIPNVTDEVVRIMIDYLTKN